MRRRMTRARRVPDPAGNHGEQRGIRRPSTKRLRSSAAGQAGNKPQMPLTSQAEGSECVTRSGRRSLLWSTTHTYSVAKAGGGAAKHTRT